LVSGNMLYGTASAGGGGGSDAGTVFALNTDGGGFTNLHGFSFNEESGPNALILSGKTLYGTTFRGGTSGNGTVFKINADGTSFTPLPSFAGPPSEGADPSAGLILSANTLYGTTSRGGASVFNGTVFAVRTDGTGFTNLHSFTALSGKTNLDGVTPNARLVLSGNTLYGTASRGGRWGNGTVFALKTDGTGFTNFYNFTAISGPFRGTNSDGAIPDAGLIISGRTLYGTTTAGGSFGNGTVFSISFSPKVTTTPAAGELVLTWPTDEAGFDYSGYALQTTTNLASSIWTAVDRPPTVVNGQNTLTNTMSDLRRFYRLSQ